MPKQIFCRLPGSITGELTSSADFAFDQEVRLLSQAYIPGILWMNRKPSKPTEFKIQHIESEKAAFRQRKKTVTLHDTWKGTLALDVFHLLYSVARVEFLKKHLFPVHAACVRYAQKNILLVGHSGAGKTALLLEVVRRGGQVFSGNKTLMIWKHNKLIAQAGTPTITMKKTDKEANQDIIAHEIDYSGRSAFLLPEERYVSEKELAIDAIVLPRLNDGVSESKRSQGLSALHTLYPYFLDSVNADTIQANGRDVFDGTVSSEIRRYLVTNLLKTLEHVPVLQISGSRNYILEQLSIL